MVNSFAADVPSPQAIDDALALLTDEALRAIVDQSPTPRPDRWQSMSATDRRWLRAQNLLAKRARERAVTQDRAARFEQQIADRASAQREQLQDEIAPLIARKRAGCEYW
jgi:hypothetical protein